MPMRKTFLKFLADKEPKMVWSPKEELIRARINTPWGATPALKLREESCLTDPTMIEWLSYAMEEVFLWACRGRTTTLLPWLSCLPEALFLSRKKETSLTDMDIFRSQFPYFNQNCLVGNSISFDMSLSDLPRMAMPKKRVEQRLAEMNWPDRWNCTMPSSLLVHYLWWTKAIGQRQDILVYK